MSFGRTREIGATFEFPDGVINYVDGDQCGARDRARLLEANQAIRSDGFCRVYLITREIKSDPRWSGS